MDQCNALLESGWGRPIRSRGFRRYSWRSVYMRWRCRFSFSLSWSTTTSKSATNPMRTPWSQKRYVGRTEYSWEIHQAREHNSILINQPPAARRRAALTPHQSTWNQAHAYKMGPFWGVLSNTYSEITAFHAYTETHRTFYRWAYLRELLRRKDLATTRLKASA